MKNIHSRGLYESPTVSLFENEDVILASTFADGDIGGKDIFDDNSTDIWF